ncbi:hypothetical protein C8R44DRAFT_988974, partial [Mycena epipterygia]
MPLLDLSPRVITSILDHLAPYSQSLDALYLAGNRNLLALTRPYTWIEVNMVLGAEKTSSSETAGRLSAFLADLLKAGATRSLNITLVAPYILRFLPLSQNVFSWETPGRLVRHAVEVLPSLIGIAVLDGCNTYLDGELEHMEDVREESEPPLPAPKPLHIATRFCHTL